MEQLDRLHRQVEPLLLTRVGQLQIGVRLRDEPVGDRQVNVGLLEAAVGLGLHGEHGGGAGKRNQHRGRQRGDRRPVPPRPPPRPPRERLTPGGHGLVGHPPLDVVGQCLARRVPALWPQCHRLEADRLQRRVDRGVKRSGRRKFAPLHLAEHLADILTLERRPAGEQAVERRAQAVHVRPRSQPVQFAARLFRAHVGGRAQRAARQASRPSRSTRKGKRLLAALDAVGPAHRLGQPPVHHQRLAVLAHDDVGRLDVAVDHAAAVGVVDGVADIGESPQELAQLQRPAAGSLVSASSSWNRAIASLSESPLMNRMA